MIVLSTVKAPPPPPPPCHMFVCSFAFDGFRERNEDSLQRKKGDGLFQRIGEDVKEQKKKYRGDGDIGDFDFDWPDNDSVDHDHNHEDSPRVSGDHFECGHGDAGDFGHGDAGDFGTPGDAFAGYA
jgi:hypothetical protein